MLQFLAPADALRQHPLFAGLNPDAAASLEAECRSRSYARGEAVFAQGEGADHAFLILEGWVKLYRDTLDGQEYIVDILPAGHLFGEQALFHDGKRDCHAMAVEPARLLALPLSALRALAQEAAFSHRLLSHFVRQQAAMQNELEHLTVQSAVQRIGCFLLRLCPMDEGAKNITLHLPYDKTLLAARLGMQRETFSRALGALQKDGYIRIEGAQVHVPIVAALSGHCCSACSNSFPCADKVDP